VPDWLASLALLQGARQADSDVAAAPEECGRAIDVALRQDDDAVLGWCGQEDNVDVASC
jgi:hypothetical protein